MRNRSPKQQPQAQAIDLTPMLDVVFIMLIFFIVTASFIKTPGVDISRVEAITADKKKASILAAITPNNEIYIDKNQVDPDILKLTLLKMYQENPKGGLIIQADNEANIEMIALIADAAIDIGLTDISVSTLRN